MCNALLEGEIQIPHSPCSLLHDSGSSDESTHFLNLEWKGVRTIDMFEVILLYGLLQLLNGVSLPKVMKNGIHAPFCSSELISLY